MEDQRFCALEAQKIGWSDWRERTNLEGQQHLKNGRERQKGRRPWPAEQLPRVVCPLLCFRPPSKRDGHPLPPLQNWGASVGCHTPSSGCRFPHRPSKRSASFAPFSKAPFLPRRRFWLFWPLAEVFAVRFCWAALSNGQGVAWLKVFHPLTLIAERTAKITNQLGHGQKYSRQFLLRVAA